jgi:type I restriction enzyme S subunit
LWRDFPFQFALAQRTIDLQPYILEYNRFFLFVLMSPIFQRAIEVNATGTAVKDVKAARLKRIRVPVPPLAELQRIVAKVEQLMKVCDQLETKLSSAQAQRSQLLESVLHVSLRSSCAEGGLLGERLGVFLPSTKGVSDKMPLM